MDSAVVGTIRLPRLAAKALDGTETVLPDDGLRRVTLVGFAFRRENAEPLKAWMKPFADEFTDTTGFRYYQVPMMGTRIPGLLRGLIERGMRRTYPKPQHSKTLPYYGDVDSYVRPLGILDRSVVHVFLLDRDGYIRLQDNGAADEEKLGSLFRMARESADTGEE